MKKKFHKLKGKMRLLSFLKLDNKITVDRFIIKVRKLILSDIKQLYVNIEPSPDCSKVENFCELTKSRYFMIPELSKLKARKDTPVDYFLNIVNEDVNNYLNNTFKSKLTVQNPSGKVKISELFSETDIVALGKCSKKKRSRILVEALLIGLLREV